MYSQKYIYIKIEIQLLYVILIIVSVRTSAARHLSAVCLSVSYIRLNRSSWFM